MNEAFSKDLIIKNANYEDVSQIVEICAQNLVENNHEDFASGALSQRGFLIKKLDEKGVKMMIDDKSNFFVLVLKSGDEVLGYLSACDISKTEKSFQKKVSQLEEINSKERVLYYKQIAKRPLEKKVGSKLILALFAEAKKRGYEFIVCKIVHKPCKNMASIGFHKKFGFQEISSVVENDVELGIYLKPVID